MIYENFNLRVDELSLEDGFLSSSKHIHTTIQSIQSDYDSFLAISNQALQTDILQTLERVNSILIELVKIYSVGAIDEMYLHLIRDKELFQIIEITHNFILPFSIQIAIQRNIGDYEYDMDVMPAFIAAETQINLLYQKILDRNVTPINSIDYEFFPVILDPQEILEQNEKIKPKKNAKKNVKDKPLSFTQPSKKSNPPSSPNDIDLNWA